MDQALARSRLSARRRHMNTITARMPAEALVAPVETACKNRTPRTRRRIQHPHIADLRAGERVQPRRSTPSIRHLGGSRHLQHLTATRKRHTLRHPASNQVLRVRDSRIQGRTQRSATRRHASQRRRVHPRLRGLIQPLIRQRPRPIAGPPRRRVKLQPRHRPLQGRRHTTPRLRQISRRQRRPRHSSSSPSRPLQPQHRPIMLHRSLRGAHAPSSTTFSNATRPARASASNLDRSRSIRASDQPSSSHTPSRERMP